MSENICELCNNTGWRMQKKNNREYAVKCECQRREVLISKSEKANIPLRFTGFELKTYFTDDQDPSQTKAKKMVKRFIDDYPSLEHGLLLQGSTGVGKTRLLCAIATELIKKNGDLDIFYIDWNDLVREMRSGEDHSTRDFYYINQLINRLSNVQLLLFDELGASKLSPWVSDNIYYLINNRYNKNKVTVCATNFYDTKTNLDQETLGERLGQRIRSRLYEMTAAVEISGDDFRQSNHAYQ